MHFHLFLYGVLFEIILIVCPCFQHTAYVIPSFNKLYVIIILYKLQLNQMKFNFFQEIPGPYILLLGPSTICLCLN